MISVQDSISGYTCFGCYTHLMKLSLVPKVLLAGFTFENSGLYPTATLLLW